MQSRNILKQLLNEFWFAPGDVVLRYHEAVIGHAAPLVAPVLDIGCGDGKITQHIFGPHLPLAVGLDPEPTGAVASGSYRKVITAPASAIPCDSASFQTVTSNSTFEHITDDVESISEIARVLTPGGRLYLTVPHPALAQFLLHATGSKEEYVRLHMRIMHLHYRSPQEWRQILEQRGLEIVEHRRYLSPFAGKVWFFFFSLATWKPYTRELWSYLSEDRVSRFLPVGFIKALEAWIIERASTPVWSSNGLWQYIVAVKRS